MSDNDTINVTFLHPRGSNKLSAEIGVDVTGEKAIGELVEADFIDRPNDRFPYSLQLQRTSASLPLSVRLVESGVKDGDVIAVTQPSEGARR